MKENMEPETLEDIFTLIDLHLAFRAIDEIEERLRKKSTFLSWRDWPIVIVLFFIVLVWIYAILR